MTNVEMRKKIYAGALNNEGHCKKIDWRETWTTGYKKLDGQLKSPIYIVQGKPIYKGATAFVYKGLDMTNGKTVAIKIANPNWYKRQHESHFKDEAILNQKINDIPGIPVVYDYFPDGATPYDFGPTIVMEFIDAPSLRQELQKSEPLTPHAAKKIVNQFALLIDSLDKKGIYPDDPKPDHILITDPVSLIDLGSSSNIISNVYTDGYSSLGRIRGELNIQTVIFSLTAIIYEILTGKKISYAPANGFVISLENIKVTHKKISKWNVRYGVDENDGVEALNILVSRGLGETNPPFKTASELALEFGEIMDKVKGNNKSFHHIIYEFIHP